MVRYTPELKYIKQPRLSERSADSSLRHLLSIKWCAHLSTRHESLLDSIVRQDLAFTIQGCYHFSLKQRYAFDISNGNMRNQNSVSFKLEVATCRRPFL